MCTSTVTAVGVVELGSGSDGVVSVATAPLVPAASVADGRFSSLVPSGSFSSGTLASVLFDPDSLSSIKTSISAGVMVLGGSGVVDIRVSSGVGCIFIGVVMGMKTI